MATRACRSRTRPTRPRWPRSPSRRSQEIERAVAEARRSFDEGAWSDRPALGTGRGPACVPRLPGAAAASRSSRRWSRRPGSRAFFAERSQLVGGVGLARNTIELYLSMEHEAPNPVPLDELVLRPGRLEHPAPRAGRRRRRDHSLQRRAPDGAAEDHPGPHGGELGHRAAEPPDTDLVAGPRCRGGDGGSPARRALGRRRGRIGRSRAVDVGPTRGHGVLHRLHRRGEADPGAGGADGEAGGARARREVGPDLPARRDRAGPDRRGAGRGHDGGAGVRRGDEDARAAGGQGRGARGSDGGLRRDRGGAARPTPRR